MTMEKKIELSGLGLIEASAGTGKTYTIQNLYLRLVAGWKNNPDGLPVESILVVTFTDAATAELKERIRQILVLGLQFFENRELLKYGPENAEKTDRAKEITSDYKRIEEPLSEARNTRSGESPEMRDHVIGLRIRRALLLFDNAMIFTIHGFCQRMLQQYAFESGLLFNTEIRNDKSTFLALESDFLRRMLYTEKRPLMLALLTAVAKRQSSDSSLTSIVNDSLCYKVVSRPDLKLTETGSTDIPEIFDELKSLLEQIRAEYAAELLPGGAASAMKSEFDSWQQSGAGIDQTDDRILQKLTEIAESAVAEGNSEWIGKVRRFNELKRRFIRVLPYYAAVRIARRFEAAKQEENFQTYDDLLQRMNAALSKSDSLLNLIRTQFKAAFVDEFQDTDPIQYEIFRNLFGDPSTGHILFFVGDPKQAIYSFRGGDIATYRKAQDYIGQFGTPYPLTTNFRSAPRLLESVNRLFTEWRPPEDRPDATVFEDKQIPFVQVSSGKADGGLLDAQGNSDTAPFKFCWAGCSSSKEKLEKRVVEFCVEHIRSLLNSGKMIPGDSDEEKPRPIRPGDIAVLVPENEHCLLFRNALNKLSIPSVITKAENVFHTPAAVYLKAVLAAVLSVTSRRIIVDAMSTPLLGYSPLQIRDCCLENGDDSDQSEISNVQDKFLLLNRLWNQNGFLKCFQEMLTQFDIQTNLLKLPSGSRILTDLMQLMELLHQAEIENGYTEEGLFNYLSFEISRISQGDPPESCATRMETDQPAVVLMTLHKSKGLEFPVVMLPFMFNKSWVKNPLPIEFYHDEAGNYCVSLDPDEKVTKLKALESKQELMRLLYVGLTRAVHSCYLYWGRVESSRRTAPRPSALDWFLPEISASGFSAEEKYPQLEGCEILMPNPVEDQPENPPETEPEDVEPEKISLVQPEWKRQKLARFQFTSFSSLAQERIQLSDGDDDDGDDDGDGMSDDGGLDYDGAADDSSVKLPSPEGIFKIPPGAAIGNAWHKILERIDFTSFDPDRDRETVEEELQTFGILRRSQTDETRKEFIDLSVQMIGHVLETPLTPASGQPFTLREVSMSDRLSELKFNYAFRRPVDMANARTAAARYVRETFGVDQVGIRRLVLDGGYLNGAIDLLFSRNGRLYIADWKSNRISGSVAGFDQEGLQREIAVHSYYFQYLIYTIAVMKYLGLHLQKEVSADDYDRYFGGVYYFFLRGVDRSKPGQGVFFNRPPYNLIHELDMMIG